MSINNRRNSWPRGSLNVRDFDLSRGSKSSIACSKSRRKKIAQKTFGQKEGYKKTEKKAPYSAPKIAQKLKSFFSLYLYLKDTNEAQTS
jgi:hypothetical protein